MKDISQGMAIDPNPAPVAMMPKAVPVFSEYNFPVIPKRHGKIPEYARPQMPKKGIAHFPGTRTEMGSVMERSRKRQSRYTGSLNFGIR
jgi:hypothetical protein